MKGKKSNKVPQRAKRYKPEMKAKILTYAKDKGVTKAAKKYNATAQIIHKWRRSGKSVSKAKKPAARKGKVEKRAAKKPAKKSKATAAVILNFAKRHGKAAAMKKYNTSADQMARLRKAA